MEPPGLHYARHHCLTHWGRVWDIGRLHQAAGHSEVEIRRLSMLSVFEC